MSYPEDKGYISNFVISLTAPANKAAMWAVGSDANSITDYRFCISNTWQSITVLFNVAFVGNAAPANTSQVWLDTSVNPNLYKIYDSVNTVWVAISDLYPIHIGAGAPADNRKIWQKPFGSSFELFKYNTVTSSWDNMLAVPAVELGGNITISDKTYDQKILWSMQSGSITIEIVNTAPLNLSFVLERNGTGRVFVQGNGVSVNGIPDGVVEITNTFSSCWVRIFDTNRVKIEGEII